jgi:ribonucleoside-diphosphate reductase alpha chain
MTTAIKKERPQKIPGFTHQMKTGCGILYVTINEVDSEIFEVFVTMGKAGGCASAQIEAIGRLVSLALRSNVSIHQITKQLQGISCHSPMGIDDNKILSCADAVAKAIKNHLNSTPFIKEK